MDTRIRCACPEDLPAVAGLQKQWAAEQITFGYGPDEPGRLAGMLGPFFVVAESEGRVVGFASGEVKTSEGNAVLPPDARYLDIDSVYVAGHARSCGIGTRMVQQLLATAERQGISRFLLYSATKDQSAVMRFYARFGFRPWYTVMFR